MGNPNETPVSQPAQSAPQQSAVPTDQPLGTPADQPATAPGAQVPDGGDEKNKQLFARAKKAEDTAKELKDKLAAANEELGKYKPQPAASTPQQPQSVDPELIETKVDLRISGYSKDEIAYMEGYAKGQGKKLSEVKDDPFIKAGIDGLRAKTKAEQATPPPTGRVATLQPPTEKGKHLTPQEWRAKRKQK